MNELELKKKYNSLLQDFKTGAQYLVDHPEKEEAAQKRLDEISEELSNIMNAFPNMTQEEKENGFKIEQVTEQVEQPKQMVVKQTTNQVATDFKTNWAIAEKLAKSSLLPEEFQGKPENVIIALGMAEKLQMDAFTICQNLHIIRGKLSWSGAFCKSLVEHSGKYTDLDFVYFGEEGTDGRGCYLEAIRTRDGKRVQGNKVTVKMAKEEQWYAKNSKWKNMTDQMLGYRAAAFFARLYCGEVLNGIMTAEENEDIKGNKEQPKDIL